VELRCQPNNTGAATHCGPSGIADWSFRDRAGSGQGDWQAPPWPTVPP